MKCTKPGGLSNFETVNGGTEPVLEWNKHNRTYCVMVQILITCSKFADAV